jgi:hypothetical protein
MAMRWLYPILPATLLLMGCPQPVPLPTCGLAGLPTLGEDPLDPWPNAHLVEAFDDGCRLAIPAEAVPVGDSQPLDTSRLSYREGFSPAGTMMWRPRIALDSASLPPVLDPAACLADDSAIQIWDLDRGVRIPCFAELDAFPEQRDSDRALLIRPMVHMGFERRIAVVVTDALRTAEGGVVSVPSRFAAVAAGGANVDPEVQAWYTDLLDRLDALGTPRERVVFAWDFPTASAAAITAPLDVVLAAVRADTAPGSDIGVTVSVFNDADDGDTTPSDVWREVRGKVRWTHFLWAESGDEDVPESDHDEGLFRVDAATGEPLPRGDGNVFFTLIVPQSVRDHDPGTVPVVVFGHGIFSSPQAYLASATDANGTIDLCERMEAICVGTEWRGLTTRDMADSLRVAGDLGRFPLLTDKLVQGVANQIALARLFETSFVDEDFLTLDGASLVDPDRIHYFGISLGGIEGATLLANSEVIDYGVLHVPGSMWATMLERSSNWSDFESFVTETQPEPALRQVIYALTQLLWDPVDPINHAAALASRSGLWQISIGDEQVPNFTAEALARTLELSLVGEPVTQPWGLAVADAPQGPGASGMVQFDSGFPAPPDVNRPAESTGAHKSIRHLEEMKVQTVQFFAEGAEGTIIHPCDGPCVFDLTD